MKKQTLNTLLVGAVTLAALGGFTASAKADDSTEKCYGVVKAGKNDCAATNKSHSCAGQAKMNGHGTEWVSVPKGLCDKLVNGSLEPKEAHHTTGHKAETAKKAESAK